MSRTDHISAVWCWRSKQSTNNVQKYQLFLKRNDRELVTFKYIDYQYGLPVDDTVRDLSKCYYTAVRRHCTDWYEI